MYCLTLLGCLLLTASCGESQLAGHTETRKSDEGNSKTPGSPANSESLGKGPGSAHRSKSGGLSKGRQHQGGELETDSEEFELKEDDLVLPFAVEEICPEKKLFSEDGPSLQTISSLRIDIYSVSSGSLEPAQEDAPVLSFDDETAGKQLLEGARQESGSFQIVVSADKLDDGFYTATFCDGEKGETCDTENNVGIASFAIEDETVKYVESTGLSLNAKAQKKSGIKTQMYSETEDCQRNVTMEDFIKTAAAVAGARASLNAIENANQAPQARVSGCFAEGTKILTSHGQWIPIEELARGMKLRSPTGTGAVTVNHLVAGPELAPLLEVTTSAGRLQVTEAHPMPTERGVVAAKNLQPGDRLQGHLGGWHRVTALQSVQQDAPRRVINVRLKDEARMAQHTVVAQGVVTGDLRMQKWLSRRNSVSLASDTIDSQGRQTWGPMMSRLWPGYGLSSL